MSKCSNCGSERYKRKDRPGRRGEWQCFHCRMEYTKGWSKRHPFRAKVRALKALLRYYGIPPSEWVPVALEQKGICAVCNKRKKLHVDHNHMTKQFRALLCFNCNIAFGYLKEDPDTILRLYHYSLKHKE